MRLFLLIVASWLAGSLLLGLLIGGISRGLKRHNPLPGGSEETEAHSGGEAQDGVEDL